MNVRLLLTFAFLALGCAGLFRNEAATSPVAAKLIVQYATIKLVDGHPDRATRVVAVVDAALADAAADPVTPEDLSDRVHDAVPWDRLDPADRLLAKTLVDAIAAELAARFPDPLPGGEDDAALADDDVRAVLGWVREAAVLFGT